MWYSELINTIWPVYFSGLSTSQKRRTEMKGQIKVIEGEYWIGIKYGSMKLLFRMDVRGKMSNKAMREIFLKQEEVVLKGGQLIESLEEVVHWGMMASSKGNKTLDTVVGKLRKIINRYKSDDVVPN